MSELVKFPAKWVMALIVLVILLFFIFSALFGAFIGRNTCKVVGSYILRSLNLGGLLTGVITDVGIKAACDFMPF